MLAKIQLPDVFGRDIEVCQTHKFIKMF